MVKKRIKREYYQDEKYFDEEIAYNESCLKRFATTITNTKTKELHRKRLKYSVFKMSLEQMITQYSGGHDVNALIKSFNDTINSFEEYLKVKDKGQFDIDVFASYNFSLWLISLAILLEVDDIIFKKLLALMRNEGKDILFDKLINLHFPDHQIKASTLLHPKPYKFLLDALNDKEPNRSKSIKKFLEKHYYKGLRGVYWHDTHKKEDSGFFGYWCFEVAAFVKKMNIDDRLFVDNMFYPKDLVRPE